MTAIVYYVSGEQKDLVPKNGKHFSLKEMQEVVGGYIEILSLPDGRKMAINEEGLIKELLVNSSATKLLEGAGYPPATRIVGNALVMDAHQLETEE